MPRPEERATSCGGAVPEAELEKLYTEIWHGCPVPRGTTVPNSVILYLFN